MLLPKAIAYYKSVRAAPTVTGISIRPPPPAVSRCLAILFATALIFFISTLPFFGPENIFSITQSRLQIPNDVLFTRLSALRAGGLTAADNALRHKLASLESRLLYFTYGPDVLAQCQFCSAEDPRSYLYYAIPSILTPHLFHIVVLALVTSGLFAGKEGARWRTQGTIAGIGAAMLEVYMVSSYNYQANARATRLEDVEAFFWKMRVYRGIIIATIDALLGWAMYLSSTNRAFLEPLTTAERIEHTTRIIETIRSKMHASGVMRNTVIRDEGLRNRSQQYWVHEGRLMAEMMEEKEVIDGVNNALEGRINMDRISHDAEMYAQNVIGSISSPIQAP
jgi:hypothetical protein